jgi:hypothetical protein
MTSYPASPFAQQTLHIQLYILGFFSVVNNTQPSFYHSTVQTENENNFIIKKIIYLIEVPTILFLFYFKFKYNSIV